MPNLYTSKEYSLLPIIGLLYSNQAHTYNSTWPYILAEGFNLLRLSTV